MTWLVTAASALLVALATTLGGLPVSVALYSAAGGGRRRGYLRRAMAALGLAGALASFLVALLTLAFWIVATKQHASDLQIAVHIIIVTLVGTISLLATVWTALRLSTRHGRGSDL